MKAIATIGALVLALGLATAQETVPLEKAQNAARVVTETLARSAEDLPKLELDLEKPFALKAEEAAFLVIPGKNLTVDKATGNDGRTVLLGQLWMLRAAPARNGKPAGKDHLRLVKVTGDNFDETLSVFFLGVRKDAWGGMELLVFTRTKEPLLMLPLQASNQQQTQPIELGGEKTSDQGGTLKLNILGKYQAAIDLVRAE